jgi:hypothetical protein
MQVCKSYQGSRPELGIAELPGCIELAQRSRVNLVMASVTATVSRGGTCSPWWSYSAPPSKAGLNVDCVRLWKVELQKLAVAIGPPT